MNFDNYLKIISKKFDEIENIQYNENDIDEAEFYRHMASYYVISNLFMCVYFGIILIF